MDFAYNAMKQARGGNALSADMGMDAFSAAVGSVWGQVTAAVAERTAGDSVLAGVYRGVLNQARASTADFRWLGQPKGYVSGEERKKIRPIKYILPLPAAALLVWGAFSGMVTRRPATIALSMVTLALLLAGVFLAISDDLKAGPAGSVHVEQSIDVPAAWSSLERIAAAADTYAAALYAHVSQNTAVQDAPDGLALAKALLDWDCQENLVPEDIRTELRLYLSGQGVEAVQYAPETKELFQLMPSNGERTVRPALVRKVKGADGTEQTVLLERGLACVRSDTTGTV